MITVFMLSGAQDISPDLLSEFMFDVIERIATQAPVTMTVLELRIMMYVLRCTRKGETVFIGQIASALGIRQSTVSRAVTRIVARDGLAYANDEDGRRQLIVRTEPYDSIRRDVWQKWFQEWIDKHDR